MRSILRKALVTEFRDQFLPRFPQFVTEQRDGPRFTWVWEFVPGLFFFAFLQPFEGKDMFVVEVAWNDTSEYPYVGYSTDVRNIRGRHRVGAVTEGGDRVWDLAPEKTGSIQSDLERLDRGEPPLYEPDPPVEQCLQRIKPAVTEAVECVAQHGLSLFRRIGEHRGLPWPQIAQ